MKPSEVKQPDAALNQPVQPTEPAVSEQPKLSHWQRGMRMFKSAWQVFKLDKELTVMPALSMLITLLATIPFIAIAIATNHSFSISNADTWQLDLGNWLYPFWFAVYLVMAIIGNFFAGAVIHGAMTRFSGGDPSISSSIAGVRRRFRPLLLFSLMMTTVGLILQILEDRVPFAGKVAVWLVGAAWNIANVFALPVIVMSEKEVQPLQATKESVAIIRKVWGESIIVNVGIGVVGAVATVGYTMAVGLIAGILSILGVAGAPLAITAGAILVLGILAIVLVSNVLDGIVKAALYHYATTGEAPATFDRQLLATSITQKKARKIFA